MQLQLASLTNYRSVIGTLQANFDENLAAERQRATVDNVCYQFSCCTGWTGDDCEIRLCPSACVDSTGSTGGCRDDGICDCLLGFTGATCEVCCWLVFWFLIRICFCIACWASRELHARCVVGILIVSWEFVFFLVSVSCLITSQHIASSLRSCLIAS